MGSKTTVSLLLHLIFLSITLTDAQYCYTTGNFTANSTYAKNRDLVLRSLASKVTANGGFYNTTIGSGNDTVYGLVHCMASPSAGNCSFCVNSSIQALMTACPNQKEAISWGGNPVPCFVRYANRYFFGSFERSPTQAFYNTGKIEATFTQFDQAWSAVRDIATRANSTNSSRNMLAAETTDLSSTQTIYVFMQCTPDVSQSNCGECLQQSVDYYKSCCYGQQGGAVQNPNCLFRWDLYPYYNLFPQVTSPSPPPPASPSPPPPASPSPPFIVTSPPPTSITITKGKENTTSRTVIATTVPIAILLALVILILTIFRFRKPKQEAWQLWNEGRGQELIDRNIVDTCPISEALRWIHIALLCVQDDPARRPTMSLVVLMLGSNAVNLPQPSAGPNFLVKFTSILSHQSSAIVSGSSFLASDQSTTSVSL
ncbi:CYSTEINE-RICH REPEAT SECRETORY PROTEIN [Salix koriyanagi]|uniref:CYSTEINE-RICH REPEAT SECRETORY PROTEIN n=2 Tax=Salix TaxID=40685 RepID=A0A9Q0UEW4_9ROSI|nr:CYSTEINE-RICH REPEAT SECRETORY PROTEIN [Salix koriyanagi]